MVPRPVHCQLGKEQIHLKSDNERWQGTYAERVDYDKNTKRILDKGRKIGIDMKAFPKESLMTKTLPWEKAWQSFQDQAIHLQMDALKLSATAALGHKLKTTATKGKKWLVGEDFKDANLKSKANLCVQ